jgi:signal transduction histidine kinase
VEPRTSWPKDRARLCLLVRNAVRETSPNLEALSRDDLVALVRELVEHQIELEAQNKELRRFQRKTEEAKNAAEAAGRAKSVLLASMSHELRVPLNWNLGMLQLLETTPLNEDQAEYVRTALDAGRRLLKLLADILDLAKIEAGKIEIREEMFSPIGLLNDLMGGLLRQSVQEGVALRWSVDESVPQTLVGDASRIWQCLLNLTSNALNFTQRGEVRVTARMTRPPHGPPELSFSVSDTGIGIPEDQLGFIFEPFAQVQDSPARKRGGTGLGLAIVRSILEFLGGRIRVESTLGKGATFHFSVPVRLADAPD